MDLVERESDLGALAELLDGLIAGRSRAVVIEGPAGIGKSRLLAELRDGAAKSGIRALTARGSELEREFPFGVVRQLFEPVLVEVGRDTVLAGAAEAARPVFEGETSEGATFAVLHGLYWLTLNVGAERPLLLTVDDLHWCDRPSLRFLAYLVPRLEGAPLMLGATLRTAEPGTDPVLLGEIARDHLTASVRPQPLSVAGIAELLGPDADPAFAAACRKATGGNPLLLRELLGMLLGEGITPTADNVGAVKTMGPSAVARSVMFRLSRLAPTDIEVAKAVAVLSDGASVADIAALTGLDESTVARSTGELARVEILRREPPLGFVHPLILEAVYREQSPGERQVAHAQAAALLRARGASHEEIATHLLATAPGGDAEVVELLREAGRSAARKGAVDSAVAYLRRAREEPPVPEARVDVLRELGLAESLSDGPLAARHLRAAYTATHDPAMRAVVAHVLLRLVLFTESPAEALTLARRYREDLPPEMEDARLGIEAFELSLILFGVVDPAEASRLQRFRDPALGQGPGAKMAMAIASVIWSQLDGSSEECARLALASLEGGALLGADPGYFGIAPITVLAWADRPEAMVAIDDALANAHKHGSLFAISGLHMWQGGAHLRRGELGEAETVLPLAQSEFNLWSFGAGAGLYLNGFRAIVQLERGDLAGARESLAAVAEHPDDDADGTRYFDNARLAVAAVEGVAPEQLLQMADAHAARHARVLNTAHNPWREYKIRALAKLGRREEARELAEENLRLARHWGAPGTVGAAVRAMARVSDPGETLPYIEEAAAVLDGGTARLEQAKALTALGRALRAARRPTEAREPLQRAVELAEACGSERVRDIARAELAASGARPRRTALSGIASLTPSEERVARLAADGMTNREVAQQLFVTPKTVEVHLSNAYRKLDIRSRRQLAGALATP
ncbi:MAG TPA: AAA family ATPase [Solirubrobacterales bacterium]|nr:AAA family ATPase [Solirubrobacterales bacterium]